MKLSPAFCRVATWLLLVLVFGLAVYRAKTQSIAHDEALTYEWFLQPPASRVLAFNSTNHVLFTLMAKLPVKALGPTELAMRIPSLIGTVGYLAVCYLLCTLLLGDGLLLPISVGMLCLNPQMLDFMPAGRGYILGMAFLSASLYLLARTVEREAFNVEEREWRRTCTLASFFLALSVASNLTNIFPATSLVVCYALIVLPKSSCRRLEARRTIRMLAEYLVLPGFLLGSFILWPYLIQARPFHFRMGNPRATDAVRDFFNASFLYKWTGDIYSTSLGAIAPVQRSWQATVSDLGVYLLLPLLFIFVVAGLFWVSQNPLEDRRKETVRCQLFLGTAITCVALTILLHVILNVSYPVSRTCLYFILLFTISGLLIAKEVAHRFPSGALQACGLVIAATLLLDYSLSVNTKYFRYNAYDVISRDMFLTIEADARSRGWTHVRIGGTWWYEPELNFYRCRYLAEWMAPYDVKDRSYFWESPNSLKPADYNYFVFTPASDPELTGNHISEVFRDRVTEVKVIAIEK